MTKFSKENLNDSNGWLSYGPERKFVANFTKRGGGKSTFITFLIKNFTVEEYFAMLDAGKAPLTIVETKGYVLPHIKKWLKENIALSLNDSKTMMIQQDTAKRQARAA